ncbi:MAG: hypothetical protein KJO07_00540 [Deltaproteobacteria bacterium]|nr:hypothetical protein [Deltaproteobacteria bacterium]
MSITNTVTKPRRINYLKPTRCPDCQMALGGLEECSVCELRLQPEMGLMRAETVPGALRRLVDDPAFVPGAIAAVLIVLGLIVLS